MNWRALRDAPETGDVLSPSSGLAEGATLCLTLGAFPVLLVRTGGIARGYVNICPHQHLPLNYRSDTLLSADSARVRCSNHGAAFDVATGKGEECALTALPIVETGGQISIA